MLGGAGTCPGRHSPAAGGRAAGRGSGAAGAGVREASSCQVRCQQLCLTSPPQLTGNFTQLCIACDAHNPVHSSERSVHRSCCDDPVVELGLLILRPSSRVPRQATRWPWFWSHCRRPVLAGRSLPLRYTHPQGVPSTGAPLGDWAPFVRGMLWSPDSGSELTESLMPAVDTLRIWTHTQHCAVVRKLQSGSL